MPRKKKLNFKIVLTYSAKDAPRKYRLKPKGDLVGVGGEIKVIPPPPYKPFVIREATPEEYKNIIFKDGKNKHLGYVKSI